MPVCSSIGNFYDILSTLDPPSPTGRRILLADNRGAWSGRVPISGCHPLAAWMALIDGGLSGSDVLPLLRYDNYVVVSLTRKP